MPRRAPAGIQSEHPRAYDAIRSGNPTRFHPSLAPTAAFVVSSHQLAGQVALIWPWALLKSTSHRPLNAAASFTTTVTSEIAALKKKQNQIHA